jgi:hypothetical protein
MGQEIEIYRALIQISVALIAVTITTYSIAISILGTEGFRRTLSTQMDEIRKRAEEKLRKGTSFEEAQVVVTETSSKLQEAKNLFSQLSLKNVVLLPSSCFAVSIAVAASGLYYYPTLSFNFGTGNPLLFLNVSVAFLALGAILLVNALRAIQRAAGQPRPASLITEMQPVTVYSEEQLLYRGRLKEEIVQLGAELTNKEHPNEIPFPVWLCNHEPELRRKLVGNDDEHDIIQRFYTALQNRYNYQKTMTKPDSEFIRLNQACIDAFQNVLLRVRF